MDKDLIEILCFSLFEKSNLLNDHSKNKYIIMKIVTYLIGKKLGYNKKNKGDNNNRKF